MSPLEQAVEALKEQIESTVSSARLGMDVISDMSFVRSWIETVVFCAKNEGQARGMKIQNEAWERAMRPNVVIKDGGNA